MEENVEIMENEIPVIEGEIVESDGVSEKGNVGLAVVLGGLAVVGLVTVGKKAIEGGKRVISAVKEKAEAKRALKPVAPVTEEIPENSEEE